MPKLLERAGCEVICKRAKVDGSFPAGTPDPTDERFMKELAKTVVEEKADFGIFFVRRAKRIRILLFRKISNQKTKDLYMYSILNSILVYNIDLY